MQKEIFLTALIAFAGSAVICPFFITIQRRRQYGQQIRADGPARPWKQYAHAGHFLIASSRRPATPGDRPSAHPGSALVSWLDDCAKMAHGRSLGLKARSKIAGQALLTALFATLLYLSGNYSRHGVPLPRSDQPGLVLSLFIFIIATSNAVSADGIDGLYEDSDYQPARLSLPWRAAD